MEDLESSVEQLSIVINDTEACLQEAQQRASALEFELAKKDAYLENLAKDTRVKAEAAIRAQKVTLPFSELNRGKTLLCFGPFVILSDEQLKKKIFFPFMCFFYSLLLQIAEVVQRS